MFYANRRHLAKYDPGKNVLNVFIISSKLFPRILPIENLPGDSPPPPPLVSNRFHERMINGDDRGLRVRCDFMRFFFFNRNYPYVQRYTFAPQVQFLTKPKKKNKNRKEKSAS